MSCILSPLFLLRRPGRRVVITRLLVVLLLLAGVARAQNGAVSVHVVDASGAAVQNASVTLTRTSTHDIGAGQTNGEGYFQFPSVVPGSYTV